MHPAALAMVAAIGFALSMAPANAAPAIARTSPQVSNIVQVAGGCGPGAQPNRLGNCISSRSGREMAVRPPQNERQFEREFFGSGMPR